MDGEFKVDIEICSHEYKTQTKRRLKISKILDYTPIPSVCVIWFMTLSWTFWAFEWRCMDIVKDVLKFDGKKESDFSFMVFYTLFLSQQTTANGEG